MQEDVAHRSRAWTSLVHPAPHRAARSFVTASAPPSPSDGLRKRPRSAARPWETAIITSPRGLPGRSTQGSARRLDALLIARLGRRRQAPPPRTLICDTCQVEGGPFSPAEAEHFVALHAELHHGIRRVPPMRDPAAADAAADAALPPGEVRRPAAGGERGA